MTSTRNAPVRCMLAAMLISLATRCAFAGMVTNITSGGPVYGAITQAVAAAANGDTLLVITGLYRESVALQKHLTVRGGYLAGFASTGGVTQITPSSGNGVSVANGSTATLANITVRDAESSGIAVSQQSFLSLSNVLVRNNAGAAGAGGVDVRDGSRVMAESVQIFYNTATNQGGGGARLREGSVLELSANTSLIYLNYAPQGGGVMLEDGSSLIMRNQAKVDANTAVTRGGGVYATGGSRVDADNYSAIGWGSSNFNHVTNGYGGGIYADGGSTIIISNRAFISGNRASRDGGGAFLTNATLIVTDGAVMGLIMGNYVCTNVALGSGGGVYAVNSTVIVDDATLSGGQASEGGGIYADRSFVQLGTGTVLGNRQFANANHATAGSGGGMYARRSTVVLSDMTVLSNVAAGADGGGIMAAQSSTVMAMNVTFDGNAAVSNGGGLAVASSYAVIEGAFAGPATAPPCQFMRNTAMVGAGCHARGSTLLLSDALVASNSASVNGGGVLALESSHILMVNDVVAHNSAPFGGAAGAAYSTDMLLLHCSLAHNGATGLTVNFGATLVLTNCIAWGHSSVNIPAGQTVHYCDVEGGYTGTRNIAADPQFVGPAALDYDLGIGSPCIDTGAVVGVTHDCLGYGRPYGSAPDLGAYEFVPEPALAFAALAFICALRRTRPSRKPGSGPKL